MLELARGPAIRGAAGCCVKLGNELNEHAQNELQMTKTGIVLMNSGLKMQAKVSDITGQAMSAPEWHIKTQEDLDSIRAQLLEARRVMKEHHVRFSAFMSLWLTINKEFSDTFDYLNDKYDKHLRE